MATYTDPNLATTNIQASIVLKIVIKHFEMTTDLLQDDYLIKVSKNTKSQYSPKYP